MGQEPWPQHFVTGEEVAYTYDSLNRLISAVTTAASDQVTTPWGQGFNYDGYGNLTAKTVLKGSVPTLSVAVDPTTNRIAGNYNYDANGNLLTAPTGGGLYYDAENRLIQAQINYVGTFYYDYDPNNKRIVTNPGQANEVFYFYGVDGKPMATATTSFSACNNGNYSAFLNFTPSAPMVRFGGRPLAKQDRLSSIGSYYPYGDDKSPYNPPDSFNFATYWKDSNTNLHYADQRYYSSQFGRFITPDPYRASGAPDDPSSWNRYTYTRGDPVNRTDALGMQDEEPQDRSCSIYGFNYPGWFCAAFLAGSPISDFDGPGPTSKQELVKDLRDARAFLKQGIERAKELLAKDKCRQLFGNPRTGVDPSKVLDDLNGAHNYGTISAAPFLPSALDGLSLFFPGLKASVFINTSNFVPGDTDPLAGDILHELGHVFNHVPGLGGSSIKDDGVTAGTNMFQNQRENEKAIQENCLR